MATTKLILRKNRVNENGESLIIIRIFQDSKHLAISTGEKIAPDMWDSKLQQVRRGAKGRDTLNAVIKSSQEAVNNIIREAKFKNEPLSLHEIKIRYAALKSPIPKNVQNPIEGFEEFIKRSTLKKRERTIKHYRTTFNHVKPFIENQYKTKGFSYADFNGQFYEDFTNHLIHVYELSNNTIGGYIKCLKTFLHFALEQGWHTNQAFKKYAVLKEETDFIYLSFKELSILHEMDLSENEKLSSVRDLFCLACFTGLRYSDIANLSKEDIKDSFIKISTIKTKDPLVIPLNTYSKEILSRYANKPIKVISNQKMNTYLKELGKLAGINEPVNLVTYSGGRRIDNLRPKYEFFSTHMARRTFITVSLERGMRAEVLMKITGHKAYKTLKKYIKIVDNVKFEEMSKAWD